LPAADQDRTSEHANGHPRRRAIQRLSAPFEVLQLSPHREPVVVGLGEPVAVESAGLLDHVQVRLGHPFAQSFGEGQQEQDHLVLLARVEGPTMPKSMPRGR
jgi:hypothetical protein